MRKSRFPLKTLIAVVLIIVIAVVYYVKRNGNETPAYKTVKVQRGDIMDSVSATGRVNPVVSVSVGTQVSGTIKKIYVDHNDTVKKGQVLIELDREVYESRLAEAKSELVARKAQVEIAKAEASLDS